MADGEFREDLYYRLNVDRDSRCRRCGSDARTSRRSSTSSSTTPAAAPHDRWSSAERCGARAYDWPGNVRELENMVERLVVFSRGNIIDVADLPPTLQQQPQDLTTSVFADRRCSTSSSGGT